MDSATAARDRVHGFAFSPTLKALEPFRDQLVVIGGLEAWPRNAGDTRPRPRQHAVPDRRAATRRHRGRAGSGIQAGISMDQVAARTFGRAHPARLARTGARRQRFCRSCDGGYSCTYTSTISWRGPTTPLPMEYNPRVVFERLFGDGGTTDPAARQARLKKDRNILDSVTEADPQARARARRRRDRSKSQEYLEAVRDTERRIQTAEQQSQRELPLVEQPAGIPADLRRTREVDVRPAGAGLPVST